MSVSVSVPVPIRSRDGLVHQNSAASGRALGDTHLSFRSHSCHAAPVRGKGHFPWTPPLPIPSVRLAWS